jgi:two-component system sensor histidine kinase QseC
MRSIRQQLTRRLLLVFGVLLGLGGAGVYLSTREALLEQFNETLRAKANAISSATEQRGNRITVELAEDLMHESDEGVAEDFFQLRRLDGTTVRRSKSLKNADLPAALTGTLERPRYWNLILPSGFRGRAIGYAFAPRNSREGEVTEAAQLTIVAASDRRELDETLATLALVLSGCGVLLLATTMVVVPRVLRRELAPLDQLAEQATRINADSLATRFPVDSLPGELNPIASRLNDLLARLQHAFERERQFSSDVAHELRTPIAELRSLAELGLQWPETRGEEGNCDALAIAQQMESIVVRLLALMRSETGQMPVNPEPILIATLIDSVWQSFAPKAENKGLEITRNIPDDARIESDPVLLRSIFSNLFDNAVEYAPTRGIFRIDCGVGSGRFTIRITNSVENLDSKDLPKLFDRLWRKDASRSGGKHSGLGLSLARAFAQALGCELTAALDGESRLQLTLSGPDVLTAVRTAGEKRNSSSGQVSARKVVEGVSVAAGTNADAP